MSVINHDEVDARSRRIYWLCRLILKPLMTFLPISERLLHKLDVFDRWASKDRRRIPGVRAEPTAIAGRPAERLIPDGLDERRVGVLYLHGGAFIACGLNTHRAVASLVARELRAPVVNVDYRQCPDVGVGTAVHDAYTAYREMRASGEFDAIVVAGDSAGGYLAAKIVEAAALDEIAGPDAYIGFSPLLNLAPDARRSSRRDAMLPIDRLEKLRPYYVRGPEPLRGNLDTTSPDVAGLFPPAVVIVGRDEALQKDALDLAVGLTRAAVPHEIHVFDGQIHAFPAAAPGLVQSRNAVTAATDFVRRHLSVRDDAASA